MLRIPYGASFPRTLSGYTASSSTPLTIAVLTPIDVRPEHYGEKVGGTGWKACKTDALKKGEVNQVVADRLAQELRFSKLFAGVNQGGSDDLQLHSDVHAFCAQAIGFIYLRVAGITAIRFQLLRSGQVLYDRKLERVVTDADPEYTGKQFSTIEGAMVRLMADSLREVIKEFISDLELRQSQWMATSAAP
jgi:hypothetical protein